MRTKILGGFAYGAPPRGGLTAADQAWFVTGELSFSVEED